MKFCPVVPEICHGQVHASRKERIRIIIIKIIIRNGAKTISPPKFVWETSISPPNAIKPYGRNAYVVFFQNFD
jgi:hypothetical protein